MKDYNDLHMHLIGEFDRHVMKHPGFAARIPWEARIVFQLEGNDAYNQWVRYISECHQEEGKPILLVQVRGLRPPKFRIARPVIAKSA
jgi:hypothetical protein